MSFDKACRSLARANRDFARLRDRHGKLDFQPKHLRSPFESLVRAIAHQQLHANAAETILGRLIANFSPKEFPEPLDLHRLDSTKLRACGFSNAKSKAIKDIALKTIDGVVPSAAEILTMSDDEIVERLTQIYGVGRWTVEMLLIFQLGRINVWPVDDFGVQVGFKLFKRKDEHPKKIHLYEYGESWQPYRTVAALYMWQVANAARAKAKKKSKKPAKRKK
jgi:DNA-3-methyladenine glycosylase II